MLYGQIGGDCSSAPPYLLKPGSGSSLRTSLLEYVHSLGEQTLANYDDQITRPLRRIVAATIVPTGLPADSTLLREVRIEHPLVRQLGTSTVVWPAADSLHADTIVVVALRSRQPLPVPEAQRVRLLAQPEADNP